MLNNIVETIMKNIVKQHCSAMITMLCQPLFNRSDNSDINLRKIYHCANSTKYQALGNIKTLEKKAQNQLKFLSLHKLDLSLHKLVTTAH